MHDPGAVEALAALAHIDRLRAFRLLMRSSPGGLSAGNLSRELEIAPSSLTFHLGVLRHAGLVQSCRKQRSVVYSATVGSMQTLLEYLINDCCNGDPALCGFEIGQTNPHAAHRDAGV